MIHWQSGPATAKVVPFTGGTRKSTRPDPEDALGLMGTRMRFPRNSEVFGEDEPADDEADRQGSQVMSARVYVATTWTGLQQIVVGDGIGPATPLEGWSMGKSVTATLLGVLMQQGAYTLDQPSGQKEQPLHRAEPPVLIELAT